MNPRQNESVLALRIIFQLFFSITFWLLFMQTSVVEKLQDPVEEECLSSLSLRVTSRGGRKSKMQTLHQEVQLCWNIHVILEVTVVATFMWTSLNLDGMLAQSQLRIWSQLPGLETRLPHFPVLWYGVCYSIPHLCNRVTVKRDKSVQVFYKTRY